MDTTLSESIQKTTTSKVLYQAVLFGIVVVLLGLILSALLASQKPVLPVECDKWDEYYIMEINLFLIGFIIRYGLEVDMVRKYLYSN
jgi:hypothetical protein